MRVLFALALLLPIAAQADSLDDLWARMARDGDPHSQVNRLRSELRDERFRADQAEDRLNTPSWAQPPGYKW